LKWSPVRNSHISSSSSSGQDSAHRDKQHQVESLSTLIGQVVETEYEGQLQKGIVRTIKRGGWLNIQLGSIQQQQQEQLQHQHSHLFQGQFIHKRFKDITLIPPLPTSTFTSLDTNNDSSSSINDDSTQKMHQTQKTHTADTHTQVETNLLPFTIPPPTVIHLDPLILQSSSYNSNTSSSYPSQDIPQNKHDQHSYIQQATYFASFRKWIVFSDLHCSITTLSTCTQVLELLFQHAKQRHAGILFLGDFWHHRQTIRIDCLNTILHTFRTIFDKQNVPMIMIPGNHDQVTLQGYEHGLTPLQNAYFIQPTPRTTTTTTTTAFTMTNQDTVTIPSPPPSTITLLPGILIFTHPTIFKKAMFIPHIRDIATVQSILLSIHPPPSSPHLQEKEGKEEMITPTQPVSTDCTSIFRNHNSTIHECTCNICMTKNRVPKESSSTSTMVESILCHADVTGAFMNDAIISTGGIAPSYFPPYIPIYSGHFHKPQHIKKNNISIRYVGSPYQVSLSEAGERKSLLVLDSDQGWTCIEEIPLDIGKKHFKCSTVEEFLTLASITLQNRKIPNDIMSTSDKSLDHTTDKSLPINEEQGKEDSMDIIQSGDRVVITVQSDDMDELKWSDKTKSSKVDETWTRDETLSTVTRTENLDRPISKLQQFEHTIKILRSMGISVEVREIKLLPNYPMVNLASIKDPFQQNTMISPKDQAGESSSSSSSSWFSLEELSPMATLSTFLYHEVERGAMTNQTASTLLDAGKALLDQDIDKATGDSNSQTLSSTHGPTHLCLESVTIQGFGPFKDSVTYPLMNRGLVLLRGSNKDGRESFDRYGFYRFSPLNSDSLHFSGSIDQY